MTGSLFVALYERKGEEWVIRGEYQMGFLNQYREEFVAEWGRVVDVSLPISHGEGFCVVVEETKVGGISCITLIRRASGRLLRRYL